jgi:hypothetical protein
MEMNGSPQPAHGFSYRVFRRLRNQVSGLEISISVLVTAEMVAKVYYQAPYRDQLGGIAVDLRATLP